MTWRGFWMARSERRRRAADRRALHRARLFQLRAAVALRKNELLTLLVEEERIANLARFDRRDAARTERIEKMFIDVLAPLYPGSSIEARRRVIASLRVRARDLPRSSRESRS